MKKKSKIIGDKSGSLERVELIVFVNEKSTQQQHSEPQTLPYFL